MILSLKQSEAQVDKYRKTYRLPDGNNSTNDLAAGRAWQKFSELAESFFPGYRAVAMDPGIVLAAYEKNVRGNQVEISRVALTYDAVMTLQRRFESLEEDLRDERNDFVELEQAYLELSHRVARLAKRRNRE